MLLNNNNKYITSIALKSSGVRARKRNKTKSLIKFKNRGHIGVIISMRGRRQIKVEKQFSGMSFCRGSVNCHGSNGQMYHFCESSRSGEIFLDQYRGGGGLYSP